MARSGATLLLVCALAAALMMAISMAAEAFVGTPASHSLRSPEVAMRFFGGGAPRTTTPAPVEGIADASYVVGITAFFFLSVALNAKGFFGPW